MESNLLKFSKYQLKTVQLVKREGGWTYRSCIRAAIQNDPDYDANQNEWQDLCTELAAE